MPTSSRPRSILRPTTPRRRSSRSPRQGAVRGRRATDQPLGVARRGRRAEARGLRRRGPRRWSSPPTPLLPALSGITDSLVGARPRERRQGQDGRSAGRRRRGRRGAVQCRTPWPRPAPTSPSSPRAVGGGWVLPVIEDARAELSENVDRAQRAPPRPCRRSGNCCPPHSAPTSRRPTSSPCRPPTRPGAPVGCSGRGRSSGRTKGKITVIDSGANEDLPDLDRMPGGLGPGYAVPLR